MEKEAIKLIACDLDGTLLHDDKRIGPRSATAFSHARSRGVRICLASGRNECMMRAYCGQLGGCDYLLSCNGAMLRRISDGKLLVCETIANSDLAFLLDRLWSLNLGFTLYTADEAYYDGRHPMLFGRFTAYEALCRSMGLDENIQAKTLFPPYAAPIGQVVKVVAYAGENQRAEVGLLLDQIEKAPGLTHEATGYGLTSITKCGVSKNAALSIAMRDAGVSRNALCAIGDFDNDLSMFSLADTRVAVSNATSALKSQATDITEANNDDGPAQFVEKLLQIG